MGPIGKGRFQNDHDRNPHGCRVHWRLPTAEPATSQQATNQEIDLGRPAATNVEVAHIVAHEVFCPLSNQPVNRLRLQPRKNLAELGQRRDGRARPPSTFLTRGPHQRATL